MHFFSELLLLSDQNLLLPFLFEDYCYIIVYIVSPAQAVVVMKLTHQSVIKISK